MTSEDVNRLVVDAFMDTGKDQTIAELAERAGVSESTIRTALRVLLRTVGHGVKVSEGISSPRRYYGPTRAELRRRLLDQCQQPTDKPCGFPGHDCPRHT